MGNDGVALGRDASATGFVTGEHLLQAARSTVALGRADLAVAFWGPKAVDLLEMPVDASGIRVACDAFSGSCSPKALAELLRRGAKVYDSPGLHAKVCLGTGMLVVGSATPRRTGSARTSRRTALPWRRPASAGKRGIWRRPQNGCVESIVRQTSSRSRTSPGCEKLGTGVPPPSRNRPAPAS